jgi:hypothetical protein
LQGDAQELRRDLQNAGVDPRELDQILRDLRQFDSDQAFVDPRSLEALQASALEKLKTMEFALRQKGEAKDLPLTLSGSEEVPTGFRESIEEYYRSIARKRQ